MVNDKNRTAVYIAGFINNTLEVAVCHTHGEKTILGDQEQYHFDEMQNPDGSPAYYCLPPEIGKSPMHAVSIFLERTLKQLNQAITNQLRLQEEIQAIAAELKHREVDISADNKLFELSPVRERVLGTSNNQITRYLAGFFNVHDNLEVCVIEAHGEQMPGDVEQYRFDEIGNPEGPPMGFSPQFFESIGLTETPKQALALLLKNKLRELNDGAAYHNQIIFQEQVTALAEALTARQLKKECTNDEDFGSFDIRPFLEPAGAPQ